jgi:hypothetical protein
MMLDEPHDEEMQVSRTHLHNRGSSSFLLEAEARDALAPMQRENARLKHFDVPHITQSSSAISSLSSSMPPTSFEPERTRSWNRSVPTLNRSRHRSVSIPRSNSASDLDATVSTVTSVGDERRVVRTVFFL